MSSPPSGRRAPVAPFRVEEVETELSVELSRNETLEDVFDALEVSAALPYAFLRSGAHTYVKVHEPTPIALEWLAGEHEAAEAEADGLYFRVDVGAETGAGATVYNEAVWRQRSEVAGPSAALSPRANTITVAFKTASAEPAGSLALFETFRARMAAAFGARLELEYGERRQLSVSGTFRLPGFYVHRLVFADFVATNPEARNYLFFGEHTKTVCEKLKLFVYCNLGGLSRESSYEPAKALLLQLTPVQEGGAEGATHLDVRVSRAQSLAAVAVLRDLVAALFALLKAAEPAIVRAYSVFPPARRELALAPARGRRPARAKKTGKRADALRALRPDMFPANWPTTCQQIRQPILIEGKEAADEYIRTQLGGDEAKAMQFPRPGGNPASAAAPSEAAADDWYVCEPRDYVAHQTRYPYPGLQANKTKHSAAYEEQWGAPYHTRYPFLPCCFATDQTAKKTTLRYRYEHGTLSKREAGAAAAGGAHVLGPNKAVGPGRRGFLPYLLEEVAVLAGGYPRTRVGTKGSAVPLLRFGVDAGPDSALHCFAKAFGAPGYAEAQTAAERRRVVAQLKRQLAEWLQSPANFEYTRQETFGYSAADLARVLEEGYVDPALFASLFEKFYDCEVLLFRVDAASPLGEIVLPRASRAYLARGGAVRRAASPTVILVLQGTSRAGHHYPYQCELVGRPDGAAPGRRAESPYLFANDRFANKCKALTAAAATVYFVAPTGRSDVYVPPQRN